MENKRGYSTLMLLAFIFMGTMVLFILGLASWAFGLFDDQISSINLNVGNQSFQEVYNQTLRQGITEMKTNVPSTMAIGLILGMILTMLMVGFKIRKMGRLWILADLGILIICEIAADKITDGFREYMNGIPGLLTTYSTTLSASATFILRLPIYIPVIGILIMLATYITYNKPKEEQEATGFE